MYDGTTATVCVSPLTIGDTLCLLRRLLKGARDMIVGVPLAWYVGSSGNNGGLLCFRGLQGGGLTLQVVFEHMAGYPSSWMVSCIVLYLYLSLLGGYMYVMLC